MSLLSRKFAGWIASAPALLLCMDVAAAACTGPDCRPEKPLDIQKFMREQAASTRAGERRKSVTHSAARSRPAAKKPARSARRAPAPPQPNAAPLPTAAASSFAAHDAPPPVKVVASDEFNAIDQAAPPAPASPPPAPETTGGPQIQPQNVQTVVADTFNEIDRKAFDSALPASPAPAGNAPPAKADDSRASWLQWIWSAVAGVFAALATAMRQLTGL
jgi:hypothetical protein